MAACLFAAVAASRGGASVPARDIARAAGAQSWPALRRRTRAAEAPGLGVRHAWTDADDVLNFKVPADASKGQGALASGILRRCDERKQTFLQAMGSRSVYNAVRAVIAAEKLATERGAVDGDGNEASPGDAAPRAGYSRIGFVPLLGREGDNQWMNLRVVTLGDAPERLALSSQETSVRRASKGTQRERFQAAVYGEWSRHCKGEVASVRLEAMGAEAVALAVKAAAFSIVDLRLRKAGLRPFLMHPRVRTIVSDTGDNATVYSFDLEVQPMRTWADRAPKSGKPERARAVSR